MEPVQEQAPQEGMEEQLVAMGQQIIGQLGPEAGAMLGEILIQLSQGAPQEAPVYARKGGKLVRIKRQ